MSVVQFFPDRHGTFIRPDERVRVVAWWPGKMPKFLVGSLATVRGFTPQGNVKVNVDGRDLTVPGSILEVER